LKRFIQKFSDNFEIGFEENDGEVTFYNINDEELDYDTFNEADLYYSPSDRITLRVAKPEEHLDLLQKVFEEDGLGVGLNSFYAKVCLRYMGITREETSDFLKHQGDYQITRPYQKIISRPILAKVPNERWEMDILVVNRYGFSTYVDENGNEKPKKFEDIYTQNSEGLFRKILVAVDVFSKKVFASAVFSNYSGGVTSQEVANDFQDICEENETYPHLLQVDNGNEFRGDFEEWIQNHNEKFPTQQISVIRTKSYSPIINGLVERLNREVRSKIKAGIATHNNLEWFNHLNKYIENINNTKSSRTGYTPNELWSPQYEPPNEDDVEYSNEKPTDKSSKEDIQRYTQSKLYRTAVEQLERGRQPYEFRVGDRVRIKIASLLNTAGSEYRKRIKTDILKKYNAVTYTPETYTIFQIVSPPLTADIRNDEPQVIQSYNVSRKQYILKDQDNNVVETNDKPQRFFGSELLLSPQSDYATEASVPNLQRSRQLNRFIKYPQNPTGERWFNRYYRTGVYRK